ncbi:MAG: helicase-exonuclease AddAB subunit AddB, partial [Eubacterium sp.]|nr:helicase-exonuclease AddAB subunit AddB [Eubacterium sp.]
MIKEAIAHPDRLFLAIVPEQFTLETQRRLSGAHPGGSLVNVDILSFDRLAHRLFEEAGAGEMPVLDDIARSFIIRRIIEEKKDSLALLAKGVDRMGYLDEIKSFITELSQYRVDSEDLLDAAEGAAGGALSLKLKDLSVIMSSFEDFLADRYMTAATKLEKAA